MAQTTFNLPTWYQRGRADNPLDTITNAILPYASRVDRNVLARSLGDSSPTTLGKYRTVPLETDKAAVTSDTRRAFLSADRASKVLASLNSMRAVSGFTDAELGSGYNYLKDVTETLRRMGGTGTGGMTRQQWQEFQATLEGLGSKYFEGAAEADIAPYKNLAAVISSPRFPTGNIMNTRTSGTRVLAGAPNPKLYG